VESESNRLRYFLCLQQLLIDAVANRVQTAVTMRQEAGSMMNVVKGMDRAMKAMDLENTTWVKHATPLDSFLTTCSTI
jgi:hypothetical protein